MVSSVHFWSFSLLYHKAHLFHIVNFQNCWSNISMHFFFFKVNQGLEQAGQPDMCSTSEPVFLGH